MTVELAASMPGTFSCGSFDPVNGYWKEEGKASRQGNKIVATVSHFCWWNFFVDFPAVFLSVRIVNPDGSPIPNVKVDMHRSGSTSWVRRKTDSDGKISGLVPAGEALTMIVFDNCDDVLISENLGPLTSDTVLPDISVSNAVVPSNLITGSLVGCDFAPVNHGYIRLSRGGTVDMVAIENGTFTFNTLLCNTNDPHFVLQGYDVDHLQETDSIRYDFTPPVTHVSNMVACNAVHGMISYQIDSGTVQYFIDPVYYHNTGEQNYVIQGQNSSTWVMLGGTATAAGTYSTNQFSIQAEDFSIQPGMPNTVVFNLSNFGAVGEFIDFTFNGSYSDNQGFHTITGMGHVTHSP